MKTVNILTVNSNNNLTQNDLVSAKNRSFKRRGRLQQKVRKVRYLRSLALLTQVSWKLRLASLILVFSILATSVFASPDSARVTVVTMNEYQRDFQFAMASSSFGGSVLSSIASDVFGFFFKTFGKQQKIERVVILPSDEKGNLNVMQGEQVNFTALGLSGNEPLSGLSFNWTIIDTQRKSPGKSLINGIFKAERPGIFVITATVGGVQSQVSVTVQPNEGIGVQKLLEKNDSEKNEREKQGLNKMRAENKVTTRDISSKNDYNPADEEQREKFFKQKQDENRLKQEERKTRKPNPLQSPENVEPKIKPEGVDRADAEGTVDADRLNAINTDKSVKSEAVVSAPYRPADEDGWGGGNWWNADDPGNGVGNPPGTSPDAGAGNGNYQFSTPVVALPGRGMDINLSLSYNSRLWSKAGNQMIFDVVMKVKHFGIIQKEGLKQFVTLNVMNMSRLVLIGDTMLIEAMSPKSPVMPMPRMELQTKPSSAPSNMILLEIWSMNRLRVVNKRLIITTSRLNLLIRLRLRGELPIIL